MDICVKTLMSADPIAVEADASALEALELMVDRGIRHLPVVDAERRVVGIVSVDDLRAALPFAVSLATSPDARQRESAREWRVGDVMTYAPETVHDDTTLGEAAERMAERRIGCLPVVDAGGHLTGILTETDVLHALATSSWTERLRARRGRADEIALFVSELRAERERIATRLDRFHATERALSAEQHEQPMDASERSADLREIDLTERLDALAARRLEAIDRALDHAAQGRLSLCDGCGGVIPLTRLRAAPGTTLCVACAREAESAPEREEPFARPPGGRAETGRVELGSLVYTRFGEGRLLRVAPFGSCRRCGDVEGFHDEESDEVRCGSESCQQALDDVEERAVVAIGEREVYVDPAALRPVDPAPFD
jgi:CBS domain-containing protein/RNA polymerase-binding transcription factor DksA